MLNTKPGLKVKTIFEYVIDKCPGRFQEGQIRTLQRRVKEWKAIEGSSKEVYFPQIHYPGILSESDFTYMKETGITIVGENFDHILYHFVLT